ncbi:hypothetical protein Tco_0545006 [Tanacetum coccineum]
MIDVYNVSHEEILKDLFTTNHPSGNPTSSLTSLTNLTSLEVNDDIFEEDIIENFLNLDKTKDLHPYHDKPLSGNPTSISEPVTKSSDFLPFPGCDSAFYENFFEVDALSLTNNEDKNFSPSLYELPFHKEVPGLGALLSFSSENKEKVFNLGILTSKRVHTSLLSELSHRGPKAFQSH